MSTASRSRAAIAADAGLTRRANTSSRHDRIRNRINFWFDKKRLRIDDVVILVAGEFGLSATTVWRIYRKQAANQPTAAG